MMLAPLLLFFALPQAHGGSQAHRGALHASQPVKRPVIPAGFSRCLFHDDFVGKTGSLPSPSKWAFALGTSYPGGPARWGTGEVQTYTQARANIQVTDDNTLLITPTRQADGTWTSARIETTADWDFGCRAGRRVRVEARIRLGDDAEPAQLGIWPAFWALGAGFRGHPWSWPAVGEVDIMESANGEAETHRGVHCGVAPGGPCGEFAGIGSVAPAVGRGEWHVFSWEVDRRFGPDAESLEWRVDGAQRWTLTRPDVADEGAWRALVEEDKMLLLNVAVGGSLPDVLAGGTTPTNATAGGRGASMEVDYVAVYEDGGVQDPVGRLGQ